MILRPVRPQSPCGPPTTKRPVGLMKYLVLESSRLDGITAWMTFSRMSSRMVSIFTRLECWAEMMTASMRAGRVPVVLDRDLALPVRAQVVEDLLLAHLAEPPRELVREHDRQRHQLFGLVAGEAEHQALVAGAAGVDAHGDVRRLLVDGGDDRAGLVVEAVLGARVADALDRLADDAGQVGVGRGRDLAGDEGQAGGDHRLAGHPAHGVLGEERVEDRVRDLVRDLVRVALGDRLRGEEMTAVLAHSKTSSLSGARSGRSKGVSLSREATMEVCMDGALSSPPSFCPRFSCLPSPPPARGRWPSPRGRATTWGRCS